MFAVGTGSDKYPLSALQRRLVTSTVVGCAIHKESPSAVLYTGQLERDLFQSSGRVARCPALKCDTCEHEHMDMVTHTPQHAVSTHRGTYKHRVSHISQATGRLRYVVK